MGEVVHKEKQEEEELPSCPGALGVYVNDMMPWGVC